MSTHHTAEPVDQHGFVLTGGTTIYGSHLAMFGMPQHRYQVVAEITVPAHVREAYRSARTKAPDIPIIVVNPKAKEMHLQDMLGPGGFPSELWQLPDNDFARRVVLAADFTAKATTVLHNRPFDDSEPYPPKPRYLVFGSGGEAHVSHYLTHRPDYQLLTQLTTVPTGLTTAQLAKGVLVDLTADAENHEPLTDPLTPHRGTALAAQLVGADTAVTLSIGPTRWFDTHELNHTPHGASPTLSQYIALVTV